MPNRDLDKTNEELVREVRSLRQKLHETEMRLQSRARSTWIEAEDLYLSLIAEALFGYYVIQHGRFRFVNPRMIEMFGYTVEEMLEEVARWIWSTLRIEKLQRTLSNCGWMGFGDRHP